MLTFAAGAMIGAWGVGEFAIAAIIICAILAILFLVLTKVFGLAIPGWFVQILWILAAAFVAIIAIKLLMSMF